MHPQKLSDDLYLIFEAFGDAGYETFYWARHAMASQRLHYNQGVDHKNTITDKNLTGRDKRFQAVLEKIRDDKNYRALVVTSFTVTHGPYKFDHVKRFRDQYPDEDNAVTLQQIKEYYKIYKDNTLLFQNHFDQAVKCLGLTAQDITVLVSAVDLVYKSRVNLLDFYFGGVLNALHRHNLEDESLVVFTADHGETLYQEDRSFKWIHGPELVPEVINVPLMIRGRKKLMPARTINEVTRSIDIYPTLAGLSSIRLPVDAGVQGIDLSQTLFGRERFPVLKAYSHGTIHPDEVFDPEHIEHISASVRDGDLVYTWRHVQSQWMFDVLDIASGQVKSTFTQDQAQDNKTARELWDYREHMVNAFRQQNYEKRKLGEDELKTLRSLGYLE